MEENLSIKVLDLLAAVATERRDSQEITGLMNQWINTDLLEDDVVYS